MMFISTESIKISWRMRCSLKLQTWGMTVTRRKRNLLPKGHDKKAVPWLSLASLEKTPTPWILLGEYMKRCGKNEIIHYTLVTFNRPSMWTHLQFPATIHFLEYHLSAPTISVLPTPTISQCCQNGLPCSTPSSTCAEIISHKNVASVRFLFSWFFR